MAISRLSGKWFFEQIISRNVITEAFFGARVQKFPVSRPRNDHEWCLRILFHLFVCSLPLDE